MEAVPTPNIGTDDPFAARSTVCLGYDGNHGRKSEKYSLRLNMWGHAPESQTARVTRDDSAVLKHRKVVQ